MSLLNNRFARLVVGVIAEIAVILLVYFLIDKDFVENITSFFITSAFIGVAALVLYDLLNIGFLNGTVGRIIKLVIFYILLIIGLIIHFSNDYVALGNYAVRNMQAMGMSRAILTSMAGSALPLVLLVITMFAREDFLAKPRWPLTLSVAEGFVVSLILSLILGAIYKGGANYTSLYIISFVIGTLLLVLGTVFFGLPFKYDSDGSWWCLKRKFFPQVHSYASSSSSSHTSSSSSHTSSGSYSNSGGYSDGDDRRTGGGALSDRMSKIARYASGTESLSYYSRLELNVSCSVIGGTIRFTIKAKPIPSDMVTNQAQVNVLRNEVSSVLERLGSKLSSEAQSALEDLRKKYSDYDRAYSIEFKVE